MNHRNRVQSKVRITHNYRLRRGNFVRGFAELRTYVRRSSQHLVFSCTIVDGMSWVMRTYQRAYQKHSIKITVPKIILEVDEKNRRGSHLM